MSGSALIASRRSDSVGRLDRLRIRLNGLISACEQISESPEVCIYSTGSLARGEATEHSDLDAFFLLTGSPNENPLSRIRDVKILNAVITASELEGFPDFSGDGEYLKFLYMRDVLDHIGGRSDDYHNSFTARMLLILESVYLYNSRLFEDFRSGVVDRYFQDFHQHSREFRPLFLLNDILRFWRTLCLNYENGRHWRVEDEERRSKGHLANLKLRFSRLNICFSFILGLLSRGNALSPEDVLATCAMTPISRLEALSDDSEVAKDIAVLLEEYAWFLGAVGGEKAQVLQWIADEEKRIEAFSHADRFTESMFNTVRTIADRHGYLRYLVI